MSILPLYRRPQPVAGGLECLSALFLVLKRSEGPPLQALEIEAALQDGTEAGRDGWPRQVRRTTHLRPSPPPSSPAGGRQARDGGVLWTRRPPSLQIVKESGIFRGRGRREAGPGQAEAGRGAARGSGGATAFCAGHGVMLAAIEAASGLERLQKIGETMDRLISPDPDGQPRRRGRGDPRQAGP
jgi:hypothetical protein